MTKITDALDTLFLNPELIFEELGNEFTSQQFLRRAVQQNQHAYIDLLKACYDQDHPFNIAHKQFGLRLKKVAEDAGYNHEGFESGDYDIFGGPTDKSKYKRR